MWSERKVMGTGSGGRYYSEAEGFPVQDLPQMKARAFWAT